jgi:hypothetical protein
LQIVSGVENAYYATTAIAFFGFAFSFFLNSGSPVLVTLFLCIGMALMGFTYGPLGTFLSEFLRTFVIQELLWHLIWLESSGSTPMIAIWLATHYSLTYVGFI